MVVIHIASPAGRLAGDYTEPAARRNGRVALFLHGWMSDSAAGYRSLPERLGRLGFATLTVDLPGHGHSTGERDSLTYLDLIDAAGRAADALLRRSSASALTVLGTSLGGFLATRLAADRPVDSLVLWVPTDFSNRLVDRGARMSATALSAEALAWRSRPHTPADSDSLRALTEFQGRGLIIQAADDELVPGQTTDNFLNAARLGGASVDHIVLSDTTHKLSTQPAKHALAEELTVAWLTVGMDVRRVNERHQDE